MFRLFSPLFAQFDSIIATFANTVSSRVMVAIIPVLQAAMVLWVLGISISVMTGTLHHPLGQLAKRYLRNAIIIGIAVTGGLYQKNVADLVLGVPDALAHVVMGEEPSGFYGLPPPLGGEGVASADPTGAGSSQGALIDVAAAQGLLAAKEAFDKAGVFTEQGVVFAFFGVLLLLATVALVALGGATIITAKVVLGILVGLGPIFVASLLFDATRHFFARWTAMVVMYGLVLVLFACLFTFMLGVYAKYMNGVRIDGSVNVIYALAGALILSAVSILVLREVKPLAMGLAGGVALQALTRGWFDRYVGPDRTRRAP